MLNLNEAVQNFILENEWKINQIKDPADLVSICTISNWVRFPINKTILSAIAYLQFPQVFKFELKSSKKVQCELQFQGGENLYTYPMFLVPLDEFPEMVPKYLAEIKSIYELGPEFQDFIIDLAKRTKIK